MAATKVLVRIFFGAQARNGSPATCSGRPLPNHGVATSSDTASAGTAIMPRRALLGPCLGPKMEFYLNPPGSQIGLPRISFGPTSLRLNLSSKRLTCSAGTSQNRTWTAC